MLILKIAAAIVLAVLTLWALPFVFMLLVVTLTPAWTWAVRHDRLMLALDIAILTAIRVWAPDAWLWSTIVVCVLVTALWLARRQASSTG